MEARTNESSPLNTLAGHDFEIMMQLVQAQADADPRACLSCHGPYSWAALNLIPKYLNPARQEVLQLTNQFEHRSAVKQDRRVVSYRFHRVGK
jgi:hypothetical protein